MKVLNFGSLNLDYVYKVDHFVRSGETLSADAQTVNSGGKGLNQSIALARAGADVYHAGCLGVGGERLGQMLRENNVNTTYLRETEEFQGNAVIQVIPSGENCILLFGGSNRCITSEQIERTLSAFSEGDYLVLQNEINNLSEIVDKAFERGMKIVLNPSPYDQNLKSVDFGKLDWLLANEVEAAQISGSKNPEDAWRVLHASFPMLSVLITLGSLGSMAYKVTEMGVETVRQDAFHVCAVDTTAAGDTFTGFFIGALLEDMSLQTCMRRASMASALSVMQAGAAGSIPSRSEVEKALAHQ